MIYGVDVSAYQPDFDFLAAAAEGIDFAFIKATEGTGWRSNYYVDQAQTARYAGLLVAAYHYVRGSDVTGQLDNIRSMVSTSTPVILDVEAGAGDIGSIRALNRALNEHGYQTPLVYIPRWYWISTMGSPDLTGLPPNWHSRYPDNEVRRKDGFTLGPEYWPSFGGIHTLVPQFTSSLAVANYPSGRIDGNAYAGTRNDLAALLDGVATVIEGEEEVANTSVMWMPTAGKAEWGGIACPPVGASESVPPGGGAWVHLRVPQKDVQVWGLYFQFDGRSDLIAGPGVDPRDTDATVAEPAILGRDTYTYYELPSGCIGVQVLYTSEVPISVLLETVTKKKVSG